MADSEHVRRLRLGVDNWNAWRFRNPRAKPNLAEAQLEELDLTGANLHGANLFGAYLYKTNLLGVDLSRASLRRAILMRANLRRADLTRSDLREASFYQASLYAAKLDGADLSYSRLVQTTLSYATLRSCRVYGASVWDVSTWKTQQERLIITPKATPPVTVDDIEVAQFVSLLLENSRLRKIIDTTVRKAVLLLGRFTEGGKKRLEAIRGALREVGYVPIVFDFEPPETRDLLETMTTLASLSRFVVVDMAEGRFVFTELPTLLATLRSVPVKPVAPIDEDLGSTMSSLGRYQWVMEPWFYSSLKALADGVVDHVVKPAEELAEELTVELMERRLTKR